MERVGYDADSGRYIFKDRDGTLWQGAQGAEFSEMTRGPCVLAAKQLGLVGLAMLIDYYSL